MATTAILSFSRQVGSGLNEKVDFGGHVPNVEGSKIASNPREIDDFNTTLPNDLLVVSPYTDPSHLLDLNSVNGPSQQLAKALTAMESTREDYATAPYDEGFNWDEVVSTLCQLNSKSGFQWEKHSFYVVVFRSQLPVATDR
jgi:hypothetical protein